MTGTIGPLDKPMTATNGAQVYEALVMDPDGFTFQKPVTLTLTARGAVLHSGLGVMGPGIYQWDTGQNAWVPMTSSTVGDDVTANISHFSTYGIGGYPVTTNTPASSDWSLALLALVGLGVAGLVIKRARLN